jgi:hypothetical protein
MSLSAVHVREASSPAGLASLLETDRLAGMEPMQGGFAFNPVTGVYSAITLGGTLSGGTLANVGTVGAGSTVTERGDGGTHQSVIVVATTLGAIAGGASLGLGKLLYTFPAGEIIVESSMMSLALTQTEGHINANAPKVGLGTTLAVGAVSVLNGTAGFMNVVTEQTAANCTGTATVKTVIPTALVPLVIATAGAHTLYANFAAAWAASGDAAAILTGTVLVNWRFMSG